MDKNTESAKMSHEALMIRVNAMCYWTFKSVKYTTISQVLFHWPGSLKCQIKFPTGQRRA